MRVAIVGYGRMGHEVEAALAARGHESGPIIDPLIEGSPPMSADTLTGCDAAIEFSLPAAVTTNASIYVEAGVPAVIGTTGWLDQLDEVKATFNSASIGAIYGSNFSVGAHLLFRIAAGAVALAGELDEYDLLIHETHHAGKKDSPSGTALSLARAVLSESVRKTEIVTSRLDRAPEPHELHVSSTRGGSVPGTHVLMMDSAADSIEIRHTARNRGGFALGAVRAAEWIRGKSGLHEVSEFVTELLRKEISGV